MLTYFRVNDPYRMLGIFGLALITRLPFILSGEHLTLPELSWMLVGEKLAGGSRLYVDVWDNIGPLSALVYHIIDLLFGRSQLAYTAIATVLVTHQALVFNSFVTNKKAYAESTYVPALVYILLSCFSFDFYTLSPVLLSLSFILLAIRNVFYKVGSQSKDNRILGTGIYLGVAALFSLPASVYLISVFVSYLLFASISPRHYLLLLYGFILPFLLAATYFFFFDALPSFIEQYLISFQQIKSQPFISLLNALVVALVPAGFLIAALYHLSQHRRFTNQQSKLQQIMLLKLLVAIIIVVFVKERAPYHLLLLIPPSAFFITYLLLMIRRWYIAEAVMVGMAILLVLNGYAMLFGLFSMDKAAKTADLLTRPTHYDAMVAGKKTLLLGNDLNVYRHARLATPYLNWQLASAQLGATDYFENLTQVYVNFSRDMPEVIVDEAALMPKLRERIPAIRQHYRKMPNQPVYIRQ